MDNYYPLREIKKPRLPSPQFIIWVLIALMIAVIITLGVIGNANAQEIDLSIIAKIESNFNPNAYNKLTQATGLFQITPICLKDFNQIAGHRYTMKEMFDPKKNLIVATWYLYTRIPQMLKYYGKPITLDNVLWAYNAGIGNLIKGIKPSETQNYITKYKRLAGIK